MNLYTVFIFIIGFAIRKLLVGLGFGVIVLVGLSSLFNSMIASAQGALASLSAETAAILAIGGVFDSMAIWGGAITTVLATIAFKRIGLLF